MFSVKNTFGFMLHHIRNIQVVFIISSKLVDKIYQNHYLCNLK